MVESSGASSGVRVRLLDLAIALAVIALLAILFVVPAIQSTRDLANHASCKSNLKQIGTACQTWATGHRRRWPHAYTDESSSWYDVGNTRTDKWDPAEEDGDPPDKVPGDNGQPVQSNTANFWVLVAAQGLSIDVFLCPNTSSLRDSTVVNLAGLRDFRGVNYCSYSYQNVLGQYALTQPSEGPYPTLPVASDANPMRRDFWSNGPGGGPNIGITNRKLAERPLFEDSEETGVWNRQVKHIRRAWELNSPNHDFRGQNVLYLDGHVEWRDHPYCGANWDNIWLRRRTDVDVTVDPADIRTLRAYNDETSYDGHSTLPADSKDDSFLVP